MSILKKIKKEAGVHYERAIILFDYLNDGGVKSTKRISDMFGVSTGTTSHTMKKLRKLGLISYKDNDYSTIKITDLFNKLMSEIRGGEQVVEPVKEVIPDLYFEITDNFFYIHTDSGVVAVPVSQEQAELFRKALGE